LAPFVPGLSCIGCNPAHQYCGTIFAVFGRGEKQELVSKKSEDEMNISAGLAKKEKKLQA
jgi:hypothetical protein